MPPSPGFDAQPQPKAPRVLGWVLLMALALSLALGQPRPSLAQPQAHEPPPRGLALLVGVGSFNDAAFTPLQYAAADVDSVAAWLVSPQGGGFDPALVWALKDQQATRASILAAAENLATQARPQDTVLLYFSTHGFLTPQRVVGIVAHDGLSTGDRDNLGSPIVRPESVLTRADLRHYLERLPASRRVVIVDVCHGGQLAGPETDPWHTPPRNGDPDRTTLILASCLGSERAWESKELGHSIFTYYLLQGLKTNGGDVLAAFELARAETERQAACEKDSCQTPYLIASPPGIGLKLRPGQGG